jgi:flagellar biosynthesis component FlhA
VNRLWLFLHLLGFIMWLGGGLASMFAGIAAKSESRSGLGAVVRAQSAIQRTIIAPGALLTALSGLMLTFALAGMASANVWLMVMQGAGLVAALLTLFVALPTATRLSRVDPSGEQAAYFDELRQRQKVVGMIWGALGLLALVGGALVR